MISFSTICDTNGTFYIKFEHNLCIIKINECLVAKNLLIKTHDSESRGQEEAGRIRDEQVSYLHVAPL